ncbi:amidohydrolase [Gordonia sp. (in: high G+C Gram-positive bacteria)]|jgi:hippurate hydrolase|uniref:amidohydrolase n=1 Tax=Gordonia sp. (in: high G+C Gram-positive bacteria) TaxID=84139 RepID=UPI001D73F504|nr:amidohydrolase [Gordonia sp. (in: high G+C Gram-positive bacteria)]MCB1296461.1 amidohydrolase [Gordonia sp. (in: high G+C Gram-positive bacteria)]HMS74292.1 amidohydrolase [Gordonia sp. (in: high G+C Gram-positive bacteria)]
MALLNSQTLERLTVVRRDIHAHPELAFQEVRTAGLVADYLRELGIDVHTGFGGTGVVGIVGDRSRGPVVGLRADMDALPIHEISGRAHASANPGIMHACGHDGHVAMLLGAAEILSSTEELAGSVVLVFQPAEEGAAGAVAMLDDGVIDRFGIEEIYGLHNIPGIPAGHFAVRPGTQLASFDHLEITITADGAHAMAPHHTGDVIVAGSSLVGQLQTIVSRRLDPFVPAVVSITQFLAGDTNNVLPPKAVLRGTARCLSAEARDRIEGIVGQMCDSVAAAHGVSIDLTYERRYPCTVNDPECAARAARVATGVAGPDKVDPNTSGILAAEDFSFFLERIPGAYAFIGNGPITEDRGPVHNAAYEFNDDIIGAGAQFLAQVAQDAIADRRSR